MTMVATFACTMCHSVHQYWTTSCAGPSSLAPSTLMQSISFGKCLSLFSNSGLSQTAFAGPNSAVQNSCDGLDWHASQVVFVCVKLYEVVFRQTGTGLHSLFV